MFPAYRCEMMAQASRGIVKCSPEQLISRISTVAGHLGYAQTKRMGPGVMSKPRKGLYITTCINIYMLCISYNYVCMYIYICTHIRIIICTSMCIHILYILHIYILFYNIIYYCIILSNSEKCIGNQKCGATLHHHLDLQHFCLSILRHWKIFLI